jgi:outer membrane receptor for ferrienterochelin and colicin
LPSGLDTIQYNSALEFFKFSSFIQATRSFLSGRLTASAGLRFDGNNYADQMLNPLPQTSPRVSLSYALTEKISINANSGRYYQHPAYTTLGYRDSEGKLANQTADLKYISADHFIGGLEYRPGNNSRITAEGFYKLYNRYPFSVRDSISLANRPVDFGVVGDEAVTSTGKGRAYGVEFLWQAKIKEKTNVTVSYTYAISEFTDKYGDYVPSSWDNRHIFIASVSHKFGKNWNAAAKWRFAGGLPYTPYDLDRSSQISAWNVSGRPYADFENVNGERFIPFHQLDLRVDRSIYFKKASMKIYLDIQNAYNFKSQELDRVTNLNESGQPVVDPSDPSRYLLRSIPSDGSGTILPTIGVILDF